MLLPLVVVVLLRDGGRMVLARTFLRLRHVLYEIFVRHYFILKLQRHANGLVEMAKVTKILFSLSVERNKVKVYQSLVNRRG